MAEALPGKPNTLQLSQLTSMTCTPQLMLHPAGDINVLS